MRIFPTGVSGAVPLVAVSLVLLSMPASAADPPDAGSEYNGAFLEPSVRGAFVIGPQWRGWAIDAGIRQAFPLSLADVRLSYRFDRLEPRDDAGPTARAIGPLKTHGVRAHLAIHPLYIFTFRSDGLGYLASSVFVEFGLGLDVHTFKRAADDLRRNSRFGWSVGAGFDVPLMDPDRGAAPWLNIVYRFSRRSVHPGALGPTQPLRTHTIFAGLGWRINGAIF